MRRCFLVLVVICAAVASWAQNADETAIRTVMAGQAMAWNRGDVTAFMQGYEDSPDTTFVGEGAVQKGFQMILGRYQKAYSTRAPMGTLAFLNIEVRPLPSSCGQTEYAVVTGNFHLTRMLKGKPAKKDGVFSLLWHKSPQGWKIVLDHTS
jgi:ketosteroid isomerase-like protein